jgi:hypothetical protein
MDWWAALTTLLGVAEMALVIDRLYGHVPTGALTWFVTVPLLTLPIGLLWFLVRVRPSRKGAVTSLIAALIVSPVICVLFVLANLVTLGLFAIGFPFYIVREANKNADTWVRLPGVDHPEPPANALTAGRASRPAIEKLPKIGTNTARRRGADAPRGAQLVLSGP